MKLATRGWQCLDQQPERPGGSRRTVSACGKNLRKAAAFWGVLLVCVLCGTLLSPRDLFARTPASAGTSSGPEVTEDLQAQAERGYVDMDSHGEGDRFVDEDGDGIDDRRMRRHQKRHGQRWKDDQQRGTVSGDGGQGAGGSKGYGAGPGPGGGGR